MGSRPSIKRQVLLLLGRHVDAEPEEQSDDNYNVIAVDSYQATGTLEELPAFGHQIIDGGLPVALLAALRAVSRGSAERVLSDTLGEVTYPASAWRRLPGPG
jgi:hypothetical protein